jgi:hypothetical protein
LTLISPFPGMSSSHLVDVYSPRVTLISPIPGMYESHLADEDCSLYYLTTSEFAHVVLLCTMLHSTTLSIANPGPSPTFCCEARRGGRDTTPWCVSPCPHFKSGHNEPKLVSRAIRASAGISDSSVQSGRTLLWHTYWLRPSNPWPSRSGSKLSCHRGAEWLCE